MKKGISLIVLVITIIVVIILAGAVILTLSNNNPIESADKSVFISNVSEYKSELSLWIISQYTNGVGNFDWKSVNANNSDIKYEGLNIQDIIKSMGDADAKKFVIEKGELSYNVNGEGATEQEMQWAIDTNTLQDNTEPQEAAITVSLEQGKITGQVVVEDNGVGIDYDKSKYLVANQSNAYDKVDPIWETEQAKKISQPSQSLDETVLNPGSYYVQVLSVDRKNNRKVNVSSAIVVEEIVASTVQTVNKTFSGATTGYSYNNPVIPAGFVAVNTKDANWNNLSVDYNNGLVIQDQFENQYVWVPVNGTDITYKRYYNISNGMSDVTPTGFNQNSISYTHRGFYVARYEASNNGGKPASKKNQTAWTYISYNSAKAEAENMWIDYGYTTTKSGLLTGPEWDMVLKWIELSGKNVTDSRAWGNHQDSIAPANVSGYKSKQITGYSENWKAKNIYDFAGNVWELTLERFENYYFARGGYYGYSGVLKSAASTTNNATANESDVSKGFRTTLYLI